MTKLKIGLDFHGVITENPEFFRDFTTEAIKRGHEVYVISGGPKKELEYYLGARNIKYTRTFSLVDYFTKKGQIKFFDNGDFRVPDELWDRAKAEYCRQNKISLQIDDTLRYGPYFSTPFCPYDAHTGSCKLNGKTIDLSSSSVDSLSEIEAQLLKSDTNITQLNSLIPNRHRGSK